MSEARTYADGLRRAEEIATKVTDDFWNSEFGRHGNSGVARMKQKVGFLIEEAIHAEYVAAKSEQQQ